jgi:hypothetical protein
MSNYDPTKMYTWTPEDKFEMSGEQFGIVLNAIRGILATPEAARILMLDKANAAIENIMAKAVEQGTVTEAEKPSGEKLRVVN